MSQRCPVCKTRLWTDPLLTPGRLSCPRCGAIFRPTVPWAYFRVLLLVVVTLALLVIFSLSDSNIWVFLFLIGVAVFFWFLPRFIDLQRISGELRVSEGTMDTDELQLKLGDDDWAEGHEEFEENSRFRQLMYLLMVIIVTLLILLLTRTVSAYQNSPPPGSTGGFGESSCHECHFDQPLNDPQGALTIQGFPESYEANSPYQVRIRLKRPDLSRAGFQLSARFAGGAQKGQQAGSLQPVDEGVEVMEGDGRVQYAHHSELSNDSSSGNEITWTLQWRAPPSSGAVALHVAANASNDDDSSLGACPSNGCGRADGACVGRSRSEEEAMQRHRRRQATKRCTATPFRPKGYGGTGSSTVLALLDNVQTLPASRRLVSDPAAPVTRPHPLLGQAPRTLST